MDWKKIIAGATSGLVAAFLIDVHAWQSDASGSKFDWGLAIRRWITGAISGGMTAAGLTQV